jgi:hypothetical protein
VIHVRRRRTLERQDAGALIASPFRLMRITANRGHCEKRVLPVKIKEAPIERLLLAQSGRSYANRIPGLITKK